MRLAALRADLETDPTTASALLADLSAQAGSLGKAYGLLGPDPTPPPDDGETPPMLEAPGDPRRWAR